MRGGSRRCTCSRYCKWQIALKRILLPAMHILLPNYTNLKKTLGQFENSVFVTMSTRENIRLIARTSFCFKPIFSAIFVIVATVKFKLMPKFYISVILLINQSKEIGERQFLVFGSRGAKIAPLSTNFTP